MIVVSIAILFSLGLVSILVRRTILGVLIGIHLMSAAAVTAWILSGWAAGRPIQAEAVSLFLLISQVPVLILGYSLSIRLFHQRKNVEVSELKQMRH